MLITKRLLDNFVGARAPLPASFRKPDPSRARQPRQMFMAYAMDAAHVRSLGATIVTANVQEFRRVRDVKVENWLG
jgi:hypothetical protein